MVFIRTKGIVEQRNTMKNNNTLKGVLALLTASFIWGIAFVAQSKGGDAIGPFTFNATRFILGGLVLVPLACFLRSRTSGYHSRIPIVEGILIGIMLAIASNLQQLGITWGASVGKAGFLTACYIVLVPIMGILIGKKCPVRVWVAVVLSLTGLYLLCLSESLSLERPDFLLLLCALFFSVQILLIDRFASNVSAVELSIVEFITCGILSGIPALLTEVIPHPAETLAAFGSRDAWIPILFASLCSTGIAYTLQIVGQAYVHPTIASLLMSLESVFSVLAGWVLLGERLSTRESMGCVLIFFAIILSQMDFKAKNVKEL